MCSVLSSLSLPWHCLTSLQDGVRNRYWHGEKELRNHYKEN